MSRLRQCGAVRSNLDRAVRAEGIPLATAVAHRLCLTGGNESVLNPTRNHGQYRFEKRGVQLRAAGVGHASATSPGRGRGVLAWWLRSREANRHTLDGSREGK